MKSLILAILLATTSPVQAQWVNYPKTIRLYNNATGATIGTVTVTGNTAYIRNKDGELIYTVVQNPDGSKTAYDPNGNVVATPKLSD